MFYEKLSSFFHEFVDKSAIYPKVIHNVRTKKTETY